MDKKKPEGTDNKVESKADAAQPDIGAGKKVLIIDDDPGTIELLRGVLARIGFEVLEAKNGQEGLTKTTQETPQLIILDVLMPEMDGFAFLKEIKKNKEAAGIPILVLTIRKNMEDTFMALGASGFISKPVKTEELIEKIRQLPLRPPSTRIQLPKTEEKK